MLLRGDDAAAYPKFAEYLYYRFPKVANSKTIVKHMLEYGNLVESMFRSALSPGMPPIVDVQKLRFDGRGGLAYSGDLGTVMKRHPGIIRLSTLMVKGYNDGPFFNENMFYVPKIGDYAPVVGGVLLHHLCHWGNYVTHRYEGGREMGEEFELATYGIHVDYYNETSVV